MKKFFQSKTVLKSVSKASEKAFEKASEAFEKAGEAFEEIDFGDFEEMSTIEQDDIKVTITDGGVTIQGEPKNIMFKDKDLLPKS